MSLLQIKTSSIQLKGCPLDIPDNIEVNIRGLERDTSLTFDDIVLPKKVEMISKGSKTCVSVI